MSNTPDPRPPPRRRFRIVLVEMPHPHGVPVIIRLRSLLKVARRVFRLRNVSSQEFPDGPDHPDSRNAPGR